jgi:hypothetical protein
MKFLAAIMITMLTISAAHAKPRRNYTYSQPSISSSKNYSYTNMIHSDDQSRCQAEANYMAANRISGHVWGTIGNFEGVGFGNSPNCNTCTPSSNMRLTGDASAQDNNGRWYRVRSWR